MKLKPIHKFNNGNGATLCNCCRVIISTGKPTDEVLCEQCEPFVKAYANEQVIEELEYWCMVFGVEGKAELEKEFKERIKQLKQKQDG